jgi:hypothetical protein
MADKSATPEVAPAASTGSPAAPATPPKRSPGHRGADVKDTVAEMTAKAHEISLEAGSKMAAAMKDVVNAAAGLTDFVLESARDLVQYMVRRGQMTQDEADKLIQQAEQAQVGRPKVVPPPMPAPSAASTPVDTPVHVTHAAPDAEEPVKPAAKKTAAKAPAAKSAGKAPAAKSAAAPASGKKTAARTAHAEKPAAKKSATAKTPAKKAPSKRK